MSYEFLVELGTEELPPTALKTLSNAFTQGICNGLDSAKLSYSAVESYATPRRLAVWVKDLAQSTPVEDLKVWGPPAAIAFKDGAPTKAAEAFAKKNGVEVSELATENDGKTDKLVVNAKAGGEAAADLLEGIVNASLAALPISKRMRWGASRAEFVRPVHWAIMLLNDNVLPATLLGKATSNVTRGHRFHANTDITIQNAQSYASTLLEQGKVVASFEDRRATIAKQVAEQAKSLGGEAVISDDLLDEVSALVEWPVALGGRFDESFLSVPAEALISSMKEHQKYFHVVDNKGALLPYFITVSNIESTDPAQVIDGNERVIRPRLADAAFFFETDKKTSLEARREKLKSVVFQAKLGTIYDKTQRITGLSQYIADKLSIDASNAVRAAQLCKSDLVSNMVYEFPEMQGIAGYSYALNDGENETVAQAIVEQYMPKFAGDTLPASDEGTIVALADRLDTIAGIFGIGQTPTGSKDPFALRRASLGALRLLVEKGYELDLRDLITQAAGQFSDLPKADSVVEDVLAYMLERFKAWYEEANIPSEVFQAVSAKQLSTPLDINNRVYAVNSFYSLPQAAALASANKRVSNILAKNDAEVAGEVDAVLLTEAAEIALAEQVQKMQTAVTPLLAERNYEQALTTLAGLREAVDSFFDDVMVMTDDLAVRNNRLALLSKLRELFLHVADISLLAVKA